MSAKHRKSGEYVSIYLPAAVYEHISRDAARQRIGVATWIRNGAIDLCPEEIRNLAGKIRARRPAHAEPSDITEARAPDQQDSKDAAFGDLVARSRPQVLALAAKGYRENAISAIARLPYRVVQHIMATEAATQKKRRKG